MAKFDIKEINYITSGKKQNTFNFGFCYTNDGNIAEEVQSTLPPAFSQKVTRTFFGNIGEYKSMSEQFASNKESLYDIDNKIIIHNIYDLSKIRLQTTAKKYGSRETQDIVVPTISSDLVGLCQFKRYAYGISSPRKEAPTSLYCNYNQYVSKQDFSYCRQLSCTETPTLLYPTPNEILNGETFSTYSELIQNNPHLSSSIISSIFQMKRNLKNIEYNYILELPEAKSYNEYDKGVIQCDMALCKNHLNYLYNMEVSSVNANLKIRYLHFVIESVASGKTGQISELKLQNPKITGDYFKWPSKKDFLILNGNYTSTEKEDIEQMFDSSVGTKWKFQNCTFPLEVLIDLGSECLDINKYNTWELWNGNDTYSNQNYRVRSFGLYYSKDGAEKSPLDVQQNIDLPPYNGALAYSGKLNQSNLAFGLLNCRDYCGIGVCGNELFATYRTNVQYVSKDVYITYHTPNDNTNTNNFQSKDAILEYSMEKQKTDYSYQHVEIIESMNRYDQSVNAGHKSSMFSLKIVDSGLNESTIDEAVKDKLRQNIKNSIRTIIDPIIPANTQLFEIYFDGK